MLLEKFCTFASSFDSASLLFIPFNEPNSSRKAVKTVSDFLFNLAETSLALIAQLLLFPYHILETVPFGSSTAINLKAVNFPHPDGTSKIINSLHQSLN